MDFDGPIDPTIQQFDIISAIRRQVQATPITWTTRRVEGHQDKNPLNVLDRLATLNCAMDTLAKQRWAESHNSLHNYTGEIHGRAGILRINGRAIHCNLKQEMYDDTVGSDLLNYWDKRGFFGSASNGGGASKVDWDVTEKLVAILPRARQHWLIKQVARVSATGRNMVRRKEQRSAACPRCGFEDEDNTHILRCQHSSVHTLWEEEMKTFSSWLAQHDTSPSIQSAVVSGLRSWYRSENPSVPDSISNQRVIAAFKLQTAIGWKALLEGCPCNLWAPAQAVYFQHSRRSKNRSAANWLRSVCKKLIDFSFTLWEHRNKAAKDRKTSIQERELNEAIDREFQEGFRGLRFVKEMRLTAPALKRSSTTTKKAWLRTVRVQREALQRKAEKNKIPDWVLSSIGIVEWMRQGKPSLPTDAIIGRFPELSNSDLGGLS